MGRLNASRNNAPRSLRALGIFNSCTVNIGLCSAYDRVASQSLRGYSARANRITGTSVSLDGNKREEAEWVAYPGQQSRRSMFVSPPTVRQPRPKSLHRDRLLPRLRDEFLPSRSFRPPEPRVLNGLDSFFPFPDDREDCPWWPSA